MRKLLYGVVASIFVAMGGQASAQSYVYYQYLPSVGPSKADFLNWLNKERASRGLPVVGYDSSLDQHSRWNSYLQTLYGLGHHWMGPARRQNSSAVPDFGKVGPAWMLSPAHLSALMDPSITKISIEMYGVYTTFSAY